MKQETISVMDWSSGRPKVASIVVSLRRATVADCDVVIGSPGLPNVLQTMQNGDAVLYETLHDGIIEVRAIALHPSRVEFLVTQVSPRPGLLAGAVDTDPNNAPLNSAELTRVAQSVAEIKKQFSARRDLASEQVELLGRKLDEIHEAAHRMGRKDWVNYVAGSLTATCIAAAFAPEVTRSIFMAVNSAFAWLFQSGLFLLQSL